ncbi:hypothetical protein HCC36_11090 [Listeria booriae]|uniref:Uncharacterized protein n=1 Tax=Listeria booriae TaxID=1552123 RepID=A0A842G2R1_9LIST|nr:hypothetical protein [Listeria booriae]MBC2293774.1 hypothetical protein [Listeria booriae]
MTQWHKIKKDPPKDYVVYCYIGLTDEKLYLQDINLFSNIIYETVPNMANAARLKSEIAEGVADLLSSIKGYGEFYTAEIDDTSVAQSTRTIYKNVHPEGNGEEWCTEEEFRYYFRGNDDGMGVEDLVQKVNDIARKSSGYHYNIELEEVHWEDLITN